VGDAYAALASELRPATPAFTKQLAPGLGLAEDPGDGQSFGMHRTLLLARAAVRAHELECFSDESREAVLSETFAEQGLDLDRPYLSAGSSDSYTLALA
ncbi:MAG TPA: T3SS effector HopA1 family protein, partial [Solirubrobacteraceae bacterium]|nr:T3SS effector HopA1 family protein [Solirubrobacteraceae bacterium]